MYSLLEFRNTSKGETIIALTSGCRLSNVYPLCSLGTLKDPNTLFLIGLENISVFACQKNKSCNKIVVLPQIRLRILKKKLSIIIYYKSMQSKWSLQKTWSRCCNCSEVIHFIPITNRIFCEFYFRNSWSSTLDKISNPNKYLYFF